MPLATAIARRSARGIREETGLTASAGVSYNKFLAKLASDQHKPNGQFVIPPEKGPAFVAACRSASSTASGPATAAKMNAPRHPHRRRPQGPDASRSCRSISAKRAPITMPSPAAIDDRPVRARPGAQVGRRGEHLRARLVDVRGHERRARPIVEKSGGYCEQAEIRGRTVTLKVKFQDFEQITRSRSFASAVECRVYLEKAALDLLSALFPLRKGVRLLGVTLSGLEEKRGKRAQLALPLP